MASALVDIVYAFNIAASQIALVRSQSLTLVCSEPRAIMTAINNTTHGCPGRSWPDSHILCSCALSAQSQLVCQWMSASIDL